MIHFTNTMQNSDKTLSWHTAEYRHRPKSAEWFWALGIISIAGAFAAILVGNILFAILIIVGSAIVALFAARAPEEVEISLTKVGILVGTRLHPYASLESFCILYEDNPPLLKVEMKNPIMPYLSIQIETVSPDDIRIFLSSFLEEKEMDPSISERIAERLGF